MATPSSSTTTTVANELADQWYQAFVCAPRCRGEVTEPAPMQQCGLDAELRAQRAERQVEALRSALSRRPTIEQAKGLLMGAFGLDADSAFETLVWVSQHSNIKLFVVAERFLAAAQQTELSSSTREELTQLLSSVGGLDDDAP